MENEQLFEVKLTAQELRNTLLALDAAGRHLGIDSYGTLAMLSQKFKEAEQWQSPLASNGQDKGKVKVKRQLQEK